MIDESYNRAIGGQDMKMTISVLALAICAVTISVAPLAGADPNNCQTFGAATVCGQGGVNNSGGQPAAPPGAGPNSCTNVYGGYQNCQQRG
jgi:hypothetical protein